MLLTLVAVEMEKCVSPSYDRRCKGRDVSSFYRSVISPYGNEKEIGKNWKTPYVIDLFQRETNEIITYKTT